MVSMSQNPMFDVVIIGGGLVGSFAAIALSQKKLRVALIDAQKQDAFLNLKIDGRTTAVAQGIFQYMDDMGIADPIKTHGSPINDIKVFEHDSPWQIHFDHTDLGDVPLGYIVENYYIRQAMHDRMAELPITQFFETTVDTIHHENHCVNLNLSNGETLKTSLFVSAEGRNSPSRKSSPITTASWDYKDVALVAHITHEKPHNDTAFEMFTPTGPLALLPMGDGENGEYRSGIVWCFPKHENVLNIPLGQLKSDFESIFPHVGHVEFHDNKRWSYPLSAMTLNTITAKRQIIIGDAAHVVHPIAGQGVNLGWRDAQSLATILKSAKSTGQDLGSPIVLKRYARDRKGDHRGVLLATDLISRLFGNHSKILFAARNAGFGIVNRIPTLRKFFMKKAMGIR